jgi:group II intron reverse transcriptase/maturase
MNEPEKSDGSVVPEKPPNKASSKAAEGVEGSVPAEGNPSEPNASRTQCRDSDAPSGLERIRLAAQRDRNARFTALLHHVDVPRLNAAYFAQNREAAPGVDGQTWADYRANFEDNLEDLHRRIHSGGYQAKASRRAYIPKPDGGQRPLGIAALEDKIAQRAVAEVLGAVYEVDFMGFSYGFRPNRRPHDALDALAYGIEKGKVNWVLDADIRGYFDAIPHEQLMQFVERRIGDNRMLRLLRKWLAAGIMEDGEWRRTDRGSPQGASISPLLANVYLHYVFDVWAHEWRQTSARGEVILVRYADDFIVGFQHRDDAERFLAAMRERFGAHGLELHPDKTRLIEFGRFARSRRDERGQGPPETFDFLGFTHSCGVDRRGRFLLRRHTIANRFRRTLARIRDELRVRWHEDVSEVGTWLGSVLTGYFAYFAVPTNLHRMRAMRDQVSRLWLRALRRRSQKDHTTWVDMQVLIGLYLPAPRYTHPWPEQRMKKRLDRFWRARQT